VFATTVSMAPTAHVKFALITVINEVLVINSLEYVFATVIFGEKNAMKKDALMIALGMDNASMEHAFATLVSEEKIAQKDNVLLIVVQMENVLRAFANASMDFADLLVIKKKCLNNCNNRGLCNDGTCLCMKQYDGKYCEKKKCMNDCSQNGECLNSGKCQCTIGFFGDDCSMQKCPGDCSSNGNCDYTTGKCSCSDGFEGIFCEKNYVKIAAQEMEDAQQTDNAYAT